MENIIEAAPQTLKALEKRKIYTNEDILNILPKRYKDYRHQYTEITPDMDGTTGVFIGRFKSLKKSNKNKRTVFTAKLKMGDNKVSVTYIGQKFMEKILESGVGCVAAFFGKLSYNETYGYSILGPDMFFDLESTGNAYMNSMKLVPVYKKFGGISVEMMDKLRKAAFENGFSYSVKEMSEEDAKEATGHLLPDHRNAFIRVHYPYDMNDVALGTLRITVDKMYDYCINLAKQESEASPRSIIQKSEDSDKKMADYIKSLPFSLTPDQIKTMKSIFDSLNSGKRVSALVQGDVGCGKTMIAFMSAFTAVFSGYQAIVCAPTDILASQHYDQLKDIGDKYGFTVEYLGSKTKAKDKTRILEGIKSGSVHIAVGTHSLCSDKIEYHNLGFVIIDEEHRFGTEQKKALAKKTNEGVNVIYLSATPIPRTLGSAMYGSGLDIYDIHTMPEGRTPIQTAITGSDESIFKFMQKELDAGRQAYIVCPLIEKDEDNEAMSDVDSVEDMYKIYSAAFPNKNIAVLNGKMKAPEIDDIVQSFKRHEIDILISTTVVEVGVNVPNASIMVISNAERFGLATLHQLRGRVGRGEYKGYCVLRSKDLQNERLIAMTQTTDGFEIAKKDLEMRGAGNLVGTEQSGFTEIMELAVKYPGLFGKIKDIAYRKVRDNEG